MTASSVRIVDKAFMVKTFQEAAAVSNVVVVDVRNPDEVQATGALTPTTHNIPLSQLAEALTLDSDAFQNKYNFPKPNPDESTLVFSCRSGMRARSAASQATASGYKDVAVYSGSANEWFA